MTSKYRSLLLVGLGTFFLSALLYQYGLLNSWQDKLLDRFFLSKNTSSQVIIIAIDDESLQKVGQWPWRREVFANALPYLSTAGALGIDISFSEPSRYGEEDDLLLANALKKLSKTTSIVLPLQLSDRGVVQNKPLSLFSVSTQSGVVNIPLDLDGIARTTLRTQGSYASFPNLLTQGGAVNTTSNVYRIQYYGSAGTFLTIPFADLTSGSVPAHIFQGKTVLIGATATDLHDIVQTPFGAMAGVEVHANSIQTLNDKSFPHGIPHWLSFLLLAFISFLSVFLVVRLSTMGKLLASLLALFIVLNLASLTAFSYNLIIPVLYLNIAIIFASGLSIALQYKSESDEKRKIRKAFQYYLTPGVIDELLSHPEKLTLGGERREMSILFSDIADFTTISEGLSPTELTSLMNEYLTAMTDVITDHGGVVDKYIGDAIMAFWGAPLTDPHHATRAATCALMMTRTLSKKNKEWQERALPDIRARIGIATGEVVVGNMGSQTRFNYTVMGDTVNLASRLEAINKTYGTTCIVSENTALAAPYIFSREIDNVRVKGKKHAQKIFELIGPEETDEHKKQVSLFADGYREYQQGNFVTAITLFEKALSIGPDGPSLLLRNRSQLYREDPPLDFNGVHTFETK